MPSWAPLTAEQLAEQRRGLSEAQLQDRKIVNVNAETVTDVSATDIPGHWGQGQDDSWDLERFRQVLDIKFYQNKPHDAAFSLIGVDASIANAFRRILIAEIPTLAIEDIFVFDNTSIIQDEVLAHRLGLIPLTGGKEGLDRMSWFKKPPPKDDYAAQALYDQDDLAPSASAPNDHNTVVMSLKVECRWATTNEDGRDGKALALDGETDPSVRYVNSNVYAHQLVFEPQGDQTDWFAGDDAIRPMNPDILIAKLRPGQRINLRCHCIKGIGGDHAKFSPVATASYRLLPHINIISPILGNEAKKFQRCFPRGVIDLVPDEESGENKAIVADPMKDTVSRECLRHEEFKGKVKLGRIRDHFIWGVESTGQFESDELFLDSVRLLKAKAEKFKRHLTKVEEGG
ncbi:DNA-directed RNA polymerase core subunit rpc40 [Recurvomyces mirabilis]|uniref:DNA-directed RNA polymerases I and III subunit RPAC1 n=1 Tax=Recurvomyces mirabilis TaxID=574656 RepID=A0AAE0TSK6_9PEZI|nr:DNA-directed RNA polymerase core subunit rpc40 [Recurvomyces mirabilis]KAK5155783.1 DNA-directed RNA polymerase core subunit rpc40 [Recurvomyces mirabilis]